MMEKKIIKRFKILLIAFAFLPSFMVLSQNQVSDFKGKDIKSNMLSFHIGAPVFNKLKIHNEGEPLLKAKYTIAPLLELEYGKLVYHNFGIKTGLGFNFVPFNTNFTFNITQENGISGDFRESQYEYNIINFNIYFLINKVLILNTKNFFSIDIGLKYNYISKNSLPININYYYYDQKNDTSIDLLYFYIYHNNDCLSIMGNINYLHHLSKKSLLIIGLTFNYSPSYVATGDYYFSNLPWESSGLVDLGINYLGLKFGYGISF